MLDVSDLNNIGQITEYSGARARGVAVYSDGNVTRAYVAQDSAGLIVYNIDNSGSISPLGYISTGGGATDVVLSQDGSKAYVTDWFGGLLVVDVSDPSNMEIVQKYDVGGRALSVTVVGTKAFVTRGYDGVVMVDLALFE